ncbi:MAG: site-specific DNA-methyltransferase [Candidatus Thermoplasmatota archaeon]
MAKSDRKDVETYEHKAAQRPNNPPVGLVTKDTEAREKRRTYQYTDNVHVKPHDKHQDPALVWATKAERTSFEVPTVNLHVHERIDPQTILRAVRKKGATVQQSLFQSSDQNLPLSKAVEFYEHAQGWSNRLVAGDSLLVMNSLIEKEAMAGKVQMVYFDPPYGIEYKSNAQPFVDKRSVAEGDKDADLDQTPEQIKAFRDTWELGIHSYLSFIRDRMLLARELLTPSGSVFIQISDQNLHHIREVMDEVFGPGCYVVTIPFKKKGSQRSGLLRPVNDYLIWYTRSPVDSGVPKFHALFEKWALDPETLSEFRYVELPGGKEMLLGHLKRPDGSDVDYASHPELLMADYPKARLYRANPLKSGGVRANQSLPFTYKGKTYEPGPGNCWKHTARTDDGSPSGMDRLAKAGRLIGTKTDLRYRNYLDDFGYKPVSNWWDGLGGASNPIYVVQTNTEVVKRCMLMTTDPGDLVIDITCGSGTTAYVAEEWGRRWMTCDTSRVAVTLAKQRLMTAAFPFYRLRHPDEGVSSGLRYKQVAHITSSTIANDDKPVMEDVYDDPEVDGSKARVTGPFTVEAVPAPVVLSLDGSHQGLAPSNGQDVARSGETAREDQWRTQLMQTGIRTLKGQVVRFTRLEPAAASTYLHATGETAETPSRRVAVSFGPEHHPMERKQVEFAWEEARQMADRPQLLVFAAFSFDADTAKDIDNAKPDKMGMTFWKVQMNTDLLTEDLRKGGKSDDSFFLVGQPDVALERIKDGEHKGKVRVVVRGFDYFDVRSSKLESGNSSRIAVWMLDPDYDGRSVFPQQVFFPMAADDEAWGRLAKNLNGEIDLDRIKAYWGKESLPFQPGKRVAVKVVDDRGIESMKVLDV